MPSDVSARIPPSNSPSIRSCRLMASLVLLHNGALNTYLYSTPIPPDPPSARSPDSDQTDRTISIVRKGETPLVPRQSQPACHLAIRPPGATSCLRATPRPRCWYHPGNG